MKGVSGISDQVKPKKALERRGDGERMKAPNADRPAHLVCDKMLPTKRPKAAPVTREGTKRPLGMEMPYVQQDVMASKTK